uniref:Zinc-finger domain-containing protein n=1 Tax=Peronospora matthiolae TaxID=2874970 RepID=A0AAV1UMB3_9STRA
MQPKPRDDVSIAVSTAEGTVDSKADLAVLKRLLEVKEEIRRWITRRDDIAVRKKNLLKLLELQAQKLANFSAIDAQRVNKEAERVTKDGEDVEMIDTAALVRKNELKELQTRAGAAHEKQQMVASVLARKLKQLQVKRKREEKETNDGLNKRSHVKRDDLVQTAAAVAAATPSAAPPTAAPVVATTTSSATSAAPALAGMHSFASAPDFDVGTRKLAEATCFRIATRHLVQTGMMISSEKLKQAFAVYTGKVLDEGIDLLVLERCLACFGEPRRTCSTSAARKSVHWQPGRQYLEIPTFISSDAVRIQSMIRVEKEVVDAACSALHLLDIREPNRSSALVRRRRQANFMEGWLTGGASASALSDFLCATIGVNYIDPLTDRRFSVVNQPNGRVADMFDDMEKWLCGKAETTGRYSSLSSHSGGLDESTVAGGVFSKYGRPFSVENESIVRQLRGTRTANASTLDDKVDPMKILCHYELNGACNDENCSNYHQKDYNSLRRRTGGVKHYISDGDDTRDVKRAEPNRLLLSFAKFRGKIMNKWPLISTQTLAVAIEKSSSGTSDALDVKMSDETDAMGPAKSHEIHSGEGSDEYDDDFLALETGERPLEIVDARYFTMGDLGKVNGDALVENVEKNPNSPNAWLLLAINQLELDEGASDEVVQLSDEERLHRQLVFLSKELDTKLRGDASHVIDVEEANLKRCLHTLSRALEVEANAYCEALWLLYLCLCNQVTNKQTQLDMAEQAVQFLPNSQALWLRYLSTYDFDSVGMAEEIYWRLLAHLAQGNVSTEDGQYVVKPTPSKQLSILLAAICFHLCLKLWNAGATHRVTEILSALLGFGSTSSDIDCCSMIRSQLRSEELIVFCLAFAHVLLFKEFPELIEHWVVASSDENIPVKGMIYNLGTFQRDRFRMDESVYDRVLAIYDLAYQTFEKECNDNHDAGGAILTNWMLTLAHQDHLDENKKTLQTFFKQKLDAIRQFSGASLVAAKLMGTTQVGREQACQLMLTMMSQSSISTFPEALHHYLSACHLFPDLIDTSNDTFVTVMERLASRLGFDVDKVKKSVYDITYGASNVLKSRAQETLLADLLAAWIDKFGKLKRSNEDRSIDQRPKQLADICVALDICQLMGILLGPSAAINGIQTVLGSSNFGTFSYEARQLAWIQRFVFQLYLLRRKESESLSWREHQAGLTRLLRKYMGDMSVEAESARQVSQCVRHGITNNAVDDAVLACLYPERRHLISFDVNLQLFSLCLNAVVEREKTAFYASFTTSLALSPDFSLAFMSIASHRWELLAARASLKKCLAGAKTRHSLILQALVALELRLRNMKAVSSLLESEIVADPLRLETWRLIVGLEILFGERSDVRSKQIAEEVAKRQLVFACNTFSDVAILNRKHKLWVGELEPASLVLRGLGLRQVPNAVLLHENLVSLDISGNELTDLPAGLCRLQNLKTLNVSENALIELPACVHGLTQLEELRLAHNNLTTAQFPELPHLVIFDVRWNAITRLPALTTFSSTRLSVLRAEGNAIPADELSRVSDFLSRKTSDTSCSLTTKESMCNSDEDPEEKGDDPSKTQAGAKSCTGTFGQPIETWFPASTEVEETSNDMDAASVCATRESDEDWAVKQKVVDAAQRPIINEKDQTLNNLMSNPESGSIDQVVAEDDSGRQSTLGQISIEANTSDEMTNAMTLAGVTIDQILVIANTSDVLTDELTITNGANEQPRAAIEMGGSKCCTEQGPETLTSDDHASGTRDTEIVAAAATNSVIDLAISDVHDPSTARLAENEVLARDQSDVGSTAASLRQSGNDEVTITRRDLVEYMELNHIRSRAEVREQNPTLWRQFLATSLPMGLELPACRLCFAPNDGYNQRFNTTVLCLRCLEDALIVLKDRNENSNEAQEST